MFRHFLSIPLTLLKNGGCGLVYLRRSITCVGDQDAVRDGSVNWHPAHTDQAAVAEPCLMHGDGHGFLHNADLDAGVQTSLTILRKTLETCRPNHNCAN